MYVWRAVCAAEKLAAETQLQQWFQGDHFLEASYNCNRSCGNIIFMNDDCPNFRLLLSTAINKMCIKFMRFFF